MSQIFVFTASNKEARKHLTASIANPISRNLVFSSFPAKSINKLENIEKQEGGFFAWGALPTKKNRSTWDKLKEGDWVLCVYEKKYRYVARVKAKFDNSQLARKVWGENEEESTWQLMYFLSKPKKPKPGDISLKELENYLSKTYMGFTRIKKNITRIHSDFESVNRFISEMFLKNKSTSHLNVENFSHNNTLPKSTLKPNDVLTNNELMKLFEVGQSGGMRFSIKNKHLILISDHTMGLYEDRWEGGLLHYTGEGKIGDQKVVKQNLRLKNHKTTGERIYLFEVFNPKEYTYVGEVELEGKPYQEEQIDDSEEKRKVYMFPLKVKSLKEKPQPNAEALNLIREKKQKKLSMLSLDNLKKRSELASGKASKRKATSDHYLRNEAVVLYVKLAASGLCDLCENRAPFNSKNGQPYLECHHVLQLSKGGEDANSNAVALCPNCHRKMHSLNLSADRTKLYQRIKKRDQK
jgi:5-methylcytosine-specific restriction enzyme A